MMPVEKWSMVMTVLKDDRMAMLEAALDSLLDYCKRNNWSGFDPYDGLNSRLYLATPLKRSKACRLVLIQLLKRLPINLRPMLLVPQLQNAKAIGLFLSAFVKLSKNGNASTGDLVEEMTRILTGLRAPGASYWCWGYSFPWQTRHELVPRGSANLVCTVFVSNSLLDAYEYNGDPLCLRMASSAAAYIHNELFWTDGDSVASFGYPLPHIHVPVHNANFLAAAFLCKLANVSGESRYLDVALKAARYSAGKQRSDGSWGYGELPTQQWVDNFHTGYNLCALAAIARWADTFEFEGNIRLGLDFYLKNFFREDGAPKYFHNSTYPIDIHSVAQSIITLLELKRVNQGNLRQAQAVFDWVISNMWDERGYFYFQVHRYYKNKISYMRWSQAWMLLALSHLHENLNDSCGHSDEHGQ